MTAQEYTCPSCGAPLVIENRFSKTVVCKYCGQTSFISHQGLDPAGKQAALAEFPSVFAVGKVGKLRGEDFRVLGRIRFAYEDGFWDEWFISVGAANRLLWLQEDEGDLTAFSKESITTAIPPFEEISVGRTFDINGRNVFVTEKNEAVLAGGEGEINFRFQPGEAVQCVDGNAAGELVSIEFTPDEIHFSKGHAVPFTDISFSTS